MHCYSASNYGPTSKECTMAAKTYSAGVKEYRNTYWEPNYSVKDLSLIHI